MITKHYLTLVLNVCCLLGPIGCATLPHNPNSNPSHAINSGQDTALGRKFSDQIMDHPGQSGIFLLGNGLDAFVGRVALARLAERTIDLQYYIYHHDTAGQLLMDELLKAADRGVRVRALIDDLSGGGADDVWTALDAHPNIQVRMFNPFARGFMKSLQWITRFKDVNHRMHNKSFTVDNQATIVGGRNIGDEYFNANPDLAFADLDALAIGTVTPEVSKSFDEYWNSAYSYPVSLLTKSVDPKGLSNLKARLDRFDEQEQTSRYITALKESNLTKNLREGDVEFQWGEARVFHDSPDKKSRSGNWQARLLVSQLRPYVEKITDDLIIISPYFVPGKQGTKTLCRISQNGIRVSILTNSLASNDVPAVHAAYAKYRKRLLECGVRLYELDENITERAGKRFTWLPGLSQSGLHAKTTLFDRKAMFIGSMNLDPRSLYINNEIGIYFINQETAGNSARLFDEKINNVAFKLELHHGRMGKESIRWVLYKDGKESVYNTDPYTGFWKRLAIRFIGLMPVESLL